MTCQHCHPEGQELQYMIVTAITTTAECIPNSAPAGVSVDVLEGAAAASGKASSNQTVQRSSVCLIVKNLPYSTSEEDLVELFGSSGQLARLVLPPTKTLALVEYTEPQDARRSAKLPHFYPLALPCSALLLFTLSCPALSALPCSLSLFCPALSSAPALPCPVPVSSCHCLLDCPHDAITSLLCY